MSLRKMWLQRSKLRKATVRYEKDIVECPPPFFLNQRGKCEPCSVYAIFATKISWTAATCFKSRQSIWPGIAVEYPCGVRVWYSFVFIKMFIYILCFQVKWASQSSLQININTIKYSFLKKCFKYYNELVKCSEAWGAHTVHLPVPHFSQVQFTDAVEGQKTWCL